MLCERHIRCFVLEQAISHHEHNDYIYTDFKKILVFCLNNMVKFLFSLFFTYVVCII